MGLELNKNRPRVLLLGQGKPIQLEPKEMQNFKWIEVDGGDIINMDHVQFIRKYNTQDTHQINFELSGGPWRKKSFKSEEKLDEYLSALKEKLGVIVQTP